jgi:biotin carboxylase
VPIIRRARQLGLLTVVTDRSASAPGQYWADVFVQVDGSDYQALLAVARQHAVDLVVAEGSDRHVPAAAYLNQQLGLRGIGPEIAHRFTNKYAMRQALEHTGVRMPCYAEVRNLAEAAERASAWGYPVVLKPKASQASLGVLRVSTPDELAASFPLSMRESTDGSLLVEQFVDGPEVTVEAFSLDGQCTVLATSEKAHYAHNPCIARRLAYPPRLPADLLAAIADTARTVVESLGLRDGLSHAEYRLRDGHAYLIEVAARGGGNAIASTIVPHVSGVDVYGLLLRKLLGQPASLPPLAHRAAVLQFLDLPPGMISAIHGREQIGAEGLVCDLELAFAPGETIATPLNDTARAGYFIVLGETRDEVDARCRRVAELLRVEYAQPSSVSA